MFWHQVEKAADGSIFIAYYGGQPAHVGLVIDGQAFHSRGEAGHVRFDKLRTLERVFTKLEFYDYAVDRSSARAGVAEERHNLPAGSMFYPWLKSANLHCDVEILRNGIKLQPG